MKETRTPVVAIYARVSSDQQAEARTIASQVDELLERVKRDGLVLQEKHRFLDEGYSGSTMVRPALERLRDFAATGGLDRLYVHSPDRLARAFAVQAVLLDELQSVGVDVKFLNHELGDRPEEQLLLHVQAVIAEYERAKILERSRRGRLHAARRGSVNVLTAAPFGYDYVREPGDREAELRIRAQDAGIVREVFKWFAVECTSITEICRRLQERGIQTPTGKVNWHRGTVLKILKNPAYRGSAAYGKTAVGPRKTPLRQRRGVDEFPKRGCSIRQVPAEEWIHIPVPRIVSDQVFAQAQEQIEANRRVAERRTSKKKYLLQGLTKCSSCGYALVGRTTASRKGPTYVYYRCTGTEPSRFGGQRICDCRSIRADALDTAVWNDVCDLLQNPTRVKQEYERRLQPSNSDEEIVSAERTLRGLIRARDRLIDAYQDGHLDKDEFASRSSQLKRRIESLRTNVEDARRELSARAELRLATARVEEFAKQIRDGMDGATWHQRKDVIRSVVKEVQVDEKEIHIVYRVDPRPFVEAPSAGGCLQRRGTRAVTVPFTDPVTVVDRTTV